jgi:citrate synthase
MIEPKWLAARTEDVKRADSIDPQLYQKYNVKRGLRNSDGTGVLVGLTTIGNVHGYYVSEGEKVAIPGQLFYRGVDVEDIVHGCSIEHRFGFEETVYLLLFGKLPDKAELEAFNKVLASNRILPRNFVRDVVMKGPSKDIMNSLARSMLTLYSYDAYALDNSLDNVLRQCLSLIAVTPMIAVYAYHAHMHYNENKSLIIHKPKPELSIAENVLYMLRPDSKYTALEAKVLDIAFMLHAEHGGGNNSTFTTHVVTSSGTDTYSTVTASLCSLKGPKHGGANIKVTEMFADIKKNVKNWKDKDAIAKHLSKILKGEAFDGAGLIYGMGHAVYSISDPRAEVFKGFVEQLAKEKGRGKEFELYKTVEEISEKLICEKRKIVKGVSANVDFYSGFVYNMLGLPMELFTPMFAVARMSGWSAHRIEELLNMGKIIRPAYVSMNGRREYIPMEKR